MNDFDFSEDYFNDSPHIEKVRESAYELSRNYTTSELLTALEVKGLSVIAIVRDYERYRPRVLAA